MNEKPNIQRLLDATNKFNNSTRQTVIAHFARIKRDRADVDAEFEQARRELEYDLASLGVGGIFDYSEE